MADPHDFYGVRLEHVPAADHRDPQRCEAVQDQAESSGKCSLPGQPGSAPAPKCDHFNLHLRFRLQGYAIQHRESGVKNRWGPVTVDSLDSEWIGASRRTNNTAVVSTFSHALQWILTPRPTLTPERTITTSPTANTT